MNPSKNAVSMVCLGLLLTAAATAHGGTPWQKSKARCGDDKACLQREAEAQCKERRAESQTATERGFVRNAIRWSCADVEQVDAEGRDDRGQESCEYYAAVQLPPENPPPAGTSAELPEVVTPGRFRTNGVDKLAIDLSPHQATLLAKDKNHVVGQCIFTSWARDHKANYPKCNGEPGADCAKLPVYRMGNVTSALPLTPKYFRMKEGFNSIGAAMDLIDSSLTSPNSALAGSRDDHFERACMHMYKTFATHWRKSDSSMGAAAMRLAECGCGLDVTKADGSKGQDGVVDIPLGQKEGTAGYEKIATELFPTDRRGFPLGGWDERNPTELPDGCRFVTETGDVGENARTLVACEIPAEVLLMERNGVKQRDDLKEWCRTEYGKKIVVSLPIPAEAWVCKPPGKGHGTAESCGTQPWVVDHR